MLIVLVVTAVVAIEADDSDYSFIHLLIHSFIYCKCPYMYREVTAKTGNGIIRLLVFSVWCGHVSLARVRNALVDRRPF